MAMESFDNIYLDLSKESGRCRFAETGFGWKPSGGGDTLHLRTAISQAPQWRKKAGAGKDQLVEMRFYIPGVTTKKGTREGDEDAGSDADEEAHNASNLFYDTLMEKAEIGDVAGDTVATSSIGRFDIDMYENSFRLRGKTYDYKIQYDHIKKFMVLPKPDELHFMICIGLDPPLRQGQTRYPFLVMQFKKDEEVTIDLNMTEEVMQDKYGGRLSAHYEQPLHEVVTQVFRGLAGKKVNQPAKDFLSHHQQYGIKCSIKASEGFLYCLEKAFININREEQKPLEDFFKIKGLRVKNEMDDDNSALLAAALRDPDMQSSDEEVVAARADRGSADEDDESVDEDFKTIVRVM
ncbi:hypothetical protein DID88_009813 [Monilinia fructigena]|uniref:FACT complex subunit POB3 n=1 Tax=Monilinia fructigena TaxID=38457 RepID=A0A395IK96_9HELO|nr:hypothetical protein DID88_009813 [Monilinia fructigena]